MKAKERRQRKKEKRKETKEERKCPLLSIKIA
jgi:hypothetical protein